MQNKNNIPENPLENAPFLSNIKKENHFSTPKNYFEVLPEIITSKSLNKNKLHFIFDRLSYRVLFPITSLIVIIFIVFNWSNDNIKNDLTNEQLSELIIDEEYIDIDNYLVYDTYSELLDEENKGSTETDEYINYLIENDIDINSIIDEL